MGWWCGGLLDPRLHCSETFLTQSINPYTVSMKINCRPRPPHHCSTLPLSSLSSSSSSCLSSPLILLILVVLLLDSIPPPPPVHISYAIPVLFQCIYFVFNRMRKLWESSTPPSLLLQRSPPLPSSHQLAFLLSHTPESTLIPK